MATENSETRKNQTPQKVDPLKNHKPFTRKRSEEVEVKFMRISEAVKEEISGNVAKSFVAQISRFHRIQASPMFHEAAEYVKTELVNMGLKDAVIEHFPADGKHKYWTHVSPMGWSVKSAELRLMEPEDRVLASYENIPISLHTHSKATPPEGVTAELVDVGIGNKPKHYEGKDVKGKFVLAGGGRARLVHEQAVYKHGAAGVITDNVFEMSNVRESLDIPDARGYQSIWPTADEAKKSTFGFSISKRQGNQLRSMLQNGKMVKLKAKVDAELFPSKLDVLTATIQGKSKPQEEVFLIAHLCHPKPGANDNASGSGLLLEIARTITSLIKSEKIKTPARTIRFIWVPETYGSVAYLSKHEDSPERLVAGINLDMVGENQELCRSTLNVDRTPDSCPSYLNDFVFGLVEQSTLEFDTSTPFGSSSTFRYKTTTYSGGSDHAEFTQADVHVPCIMLLQWPDMYYHTSMDTIDKVSEDSLRRIGWVATVAALTLAHGETETALRLIHQTRTRGTSRIEEIAREGIEELFKKKEDPKLKKGKSELAKQLTKILLRYKNRLEHAGWREQQAIESTKRIAQNPATDAALKESCEQIAKLSKNEVELLEKTLTFLGKKLKIRISAKLKETESSTRSGKLHPKRLFKGTLGISLKKELGEKKYEWYEKKIESDPGFNLKLFEILNFADGKRNLNEIARAVSAEYTETDPGDVTKILQDLKKLRLVLFQ
jgi:aminopeptidase YwaD